MTPQPGEILRAFFRVGRKRLGTASGDSPDVRATLVSYRQHGCRIEAAPFPVPDSSLRSSGAIGVGPSPPNQGGLVLDLLFIGLTIVVFAALWLLVKGVERFER